MMTRKDYTKAAEMVRRMEKSYPNLDHYIVVDFLKEFFFQDNPRFDGERFERACNKDIKKG